MRERSRDCRPINDRQLMELSTSTTLQGVFLALRHDFGTENLASPALFTTSPQPRSRLFAIFSPPHFNDIGPWIPSNPQSLPHSGTGPKYANQGEKIFLFLPPTATADPRAVMQNFYASQFRRLNHQPGHGYRALLSYQTVAQAAILVPYHSPGPSFDSDLRLFLPFRRQKGNHDGGWAWFPARLEANRSPPNLAGDPARDFPERRTPSRECEGL